MTTSWLVGDYLIQTNQVLGSGIQAKVVPGENMLTGKKIVAKLTMLDSKTNLFETELSILKKLKDCDGVVRMEASFVHENYGITIMEKMPHDLMTLLEEDRITLPQRLHIFKLVALALKQCHQNNIAHLDLKPENILVSDDYLRVKICDFGSAQVIPHHGLTKSTGGTLLYTAPETLNCDFFDGKQADMWSMGVLYHILICNFWPYVGHDERQLKRKVSKGLISVNDDLSQCQVQTLVQMLKFHPDDRIDIAGLCELLLPPSRKLIRRPSLKRIKQLLKL